MTPDNSKSYLQDLIRLTRYNLIACGFEKLLVSNTVVGLASIPDDAKYAIIQIESSISTPSIRYLELGNTTLPTTTVGISRSNLDIMDVHGYQNLVNFRAIQISAGVHNLNIQYYR